MLKAAAETILPTLRLFLIPIGCWILFWCTYNTLLFVDKFWKHCCNFFFSVGAPMAKKSEKAKARGRPSTTRHATQSCCAYGSCLRSSFSALHEAWPGPPISVPCRHEMARLPSIPRHRKRYYVNVKTPKANNNNEQIIIKGAFVLQKLWWEFELLGVFDSMPVIVP